VLSSNGDVADWQLNLDQRVRCVVSVVRQSLTVGTKVGVVADSALVSVASDVSLVGCAQRPVTVDATVGWLRNTYGSDRCVNGCEPMAGVLLASSSNAGRTIVEVRAG
jgi:hypothetical protein